MNKKITARDFVELKKATKDELIIKTKEEGKIVEIPHFAGLLVNHQDYEVERWEVVKGKLVIWVK